MRLQDRLCKQRSRHSHHRLVLRAGVLWFVVCGVWFVVYGLWFVVCGLWFMVCGLWFVVLRFSNRQLCVQVITDGFGHGEPATSLCFTHDNTQLVTVSGLGFWVWGLGFGV